jgi:hypothetical protein
MQMSPDGHYQFWTALMRAAEIVKIADDRADDLVANHVSAYAAIQACDPGWRPDSQGYYFIDSRGDFPDHANPVRLLLTHPPFPIWAWVWRGAGIAASLALLVLAWRVRP